jgi:tRNA (guanine-N7-)-methyltransferase
MTQRMIEINSPFFLREEGLTTPIDMADIFGNPRPLALEIGCGIGDFIVQLAAQRPERNFLAIDIYNKGCYKTCRRLEEAGLNNVRVLRMEARYLLARFLARESLAAVYINCPDPWPKKRHRGRRLVNRTFLQALLHFLRPGGELYFSSDFNDYAQNVAVALTGLKGYENRLKDAITPTPADYPLSKYMRRFLAQGQPIHYLQQRKKPDYRCQGEPLPSDRPGFRASWSLLSHG